MEDPEPAFRSFEEFWPFSVGQHTKRGTRALHFAGTTLGSLFLAGALASGRLFLLLWGLAVSYGNRESRVLSRRTGLVLSTPGFRLLD